jgi:hypothetical protein
MRRFLILIALLLGLGLTALPAPANADSVATMHLGATGAYWGGTSYLVGGGGPYDLTLVSTDGLMSGTAFLGILIPNTTAGISVSIGTGLETSNVLFDSGFLGGIGVLNEPGLTDYNFGSMRSASGQVIPTPAGFKFYASDWNLGAYSSSNSTGGLTFTVDSLPAGTVLVAWLEDGSGNAIERTPLSESLTVVPEPGILILLGIAMSAIGIAVPFLRKI